IDGVAVCDPASETYYGMGRMASGFEVPFKGDGSIDDKEIAVLERIAAWMDINKESIFGTRPWKVFGEGPAADASNPIKAQGFNEGKIKYSARDIRFNQKGNILYVTLMGVPEGPVTIQNLNSATAKISRIEMLGSKEKLKWKQDAQYLKIEKPSGIPNEIAIVFKVYMN
ncbi:MAG TPA: alpha-L-fucosidase C-terminal domain-containing protein, partial [Bacteroidales bacterium]|nr:alpha-L-fucosidase C-terminal domain-containing protein [Bacteroidales bacterium]